MTDREWPFAFECRRSGNCCSRPEGIVRVSDEDVARIAGHLGLDERAFRARFVDGDRLKQGVGPRCVFLVDGAETSCAIHAVRPERCASWPYWPELLVDEASLAEAARLCPGIRLTASGTRSASASARTRSPST